MREILAPDRGWLHCGPAGSGYFVAMILDGIGPEPGGAVSAPTKPRVTVPVSSLALKLQSGRAGGNTHAGRLLAAINEILNVETVIARDSIK